MVKLYAALGQPTYYDQKYYSYFCGSYRVLIKTNTACTQIANYFEGRIREKEEAVDVSKIALGLLNVKEKISAEDIIDKLEKSKLLISATGLNRKLAVYHLLEECSYQIKFPDAKKAPNLEKFYYARKPHKLKGLERALYDIFFDNYKRMENLQIEVIHGYDTYRQYYITLSILMKKLPPKTYTVGEVLSALEQLYEKNCISLYPKKPTFKIADGELKTYYYA